MKKLLPTIALGLAAGALCGAGAVGASTRRASEDGPVLLVPAALGEIAIDGELEDWPRTPALTGPFTAGGKPARPYSDARFVHRNGMLHVVLYAADEDIRATDARHDDPLWIADAFEVVFQTSGGDRVVEVSPRGVVTDAARDRHGKLDSTWESHAKVAVDLDGVINDTADEDEEWVVEMAIPLASLGLEEKTGERVGVTLRRCDVVRGSGRSCGGWSGVLELGR